MSTRRTPSGWRAGLRARLATLLPALLTPLLALLVAPAPALAAPQAKRVHGPFEILAQERRIGRGAWPNQGGSPFATQAVTTFTLRWRGQAVEVPGRGSHFWQVLRLVDAPRPALLLVTHDFTLVSEHEGRLQVQPLKSESASLAEAQWLDSEDGQPGEPQRWGLGHIDLQRANELETRTRLQGGRWLRLGSRGVLALDTMTLHAVQPWVAHGPGEPVTSLAREGDRVRAFSPGRTAYVLGGAQIDYARGRGTVHGLLVVSLAGGPTRELRLRRTSTPFAAVADIDLEWVQHHFAWQRDAQGREQLVPRAGAGRLPWRGRLDSGPTSEPKYHVPRALPAFADELRRIVLSLPGAALAPDPVDPRRGIDGMTLRVGGCLLALTVSTSGMPDDDPHDGSVGVHAVGRTSAEEAACDEVVRRIAKATDAELASGRHDALIVLE